MQEITIISFCTRKEINICTTLGWTAARRVAGTPCTQLAEVHMMQTLASAVSTGLEDVLLGLDVGVLDRQGHATCVEYECAGVRMQATAAILHLQSSNHPSVRQTNQACVRPSVCQTGKSELASRRRITG